MRAGVLPRARKTSTCRPERSLATQLRRLLNFDQGSGPVEGAKTFRLRRLRRSVVEDESVQRAGHLEDPLDLPRTPQQRKLTTILVAA